ncbi:MAG: hypothetical protein JST63_03210 [Bacteroidetes bacterium]|nr:hypothetical protein [Bacteroidota bacterium]
MENTQSPAQSIITKPVRPVFLTVLCILTFIGSGLSIIGSSFSYITADTRADLVQTAMDDAKNKIDEGGNANSGIAKRIISDTNELVKPENMKRSDIFSIVASICTLLGAMLMFRLKKSGYWLYILGTILGIAGPLYIFGENFISMLSTIGTGGIGIVFVILYGLNLKYLK